MRKPGHWTAALLLALAAGCAHAEATWLALDIGRGEARLPVYAMSRPDARATLILLPGGDAGTGKIVNGHPSSHNFLSRSRDEFFAEHFNVLVVYRPSDLQTLDYSYRTSPAHMGELAKVIAYAQQWKQPVWLVGTSRGTVSGTAAAIALGKTQVQGLVLTSSVTSGKPGAIATQNLASLNIPVLVAHHKNDACPICVPSEAHRITADLTAAPVKKFVLIEGGSDPEGQPCQARHWHGFIRYEKETVKIITDWIQRPQS